MFAAFFPHRVLHLFALSLPLLLCSSSLLANAAFVVNYPDGSTLSVSLAGSAGDTARVTVVPKGANSSFRRYQGFLNATALTPAETFTVGANTSTYTVLARPGWSLNVSRVVPTVSLLVQGVVVSAELAGPAKIQGAACDPPGWKGLAPGIGVTVAATGSCLRGTRSLSGGATTTTTTTTTTTSTPLTGVQGEAITTPLTGVQGEAIYGFGQTVTKGLSAVGSTKFIATFSRTLDTGPSHAPSPSYISLARDKQTNKSLAHGFFLNTHGYSAFDVGHSNSGELLVSSPDPIYDYFLFAGPTPRAVIGQFSEVVGGRLSLPPKWAMGMKYDPAEAAYNTTFIDTVVQQFADRGVRPDRVVLEPAWQGQQYNWDGSKFGDVPALIKSIAPTKLVLWEHPILTPAGSPGTAADGFYDSLAKANCLGATAAAAAAAVAAAAGTAKAATNSGAALAPGRRLGMPAPDQFTDLTLPHCQELWKSYQLKHAIASGALGFKLDEDDVDVDVGFNDSTVFPSGFRGYEYHNIQGYIWQRLFHEMFHSLGQRTWLQSRGGYAGSQAYPTNSYSDGYTYSTYVLGVVNSGFSGLIWAPEMRHATCGPNHSAKDHADFARRTQLMFLSPQAQYNAWDSKDGTTLWPTGGPGAANCSQEWMAMFKKHYDLRAGLADYLYSAFEDQSRTGVAVARALVVDEPDDAEVWQIDDQFFLGPTLMFPPAGMTDPESTSRRIYFPKNAGSWHSWFKKENGTYAHYGPGTWATYSTDIMTAPLFVKGGMPVLFNDRSRNYQGDEKGVAAAASVSAAVEAAQHEEIGISVWVPPVEATVNDRACSGSAAAVAVAAKDRDDDDFEWASFYDDDGETTAYESRGEHWRGAAGFARCADGRLLLRFRVDHATTTYATTRRRVVWTLNNVGGGGSGGSSGGGGTKSMAVECAAETEREWSQVEPEEGRVRVSAAIGDSGHSCVVVVRG